MDVQGKNAVVIGGVSGIGLACVKELLKNGVKKLVIIDYNETLFQNIKKEISEEFGATRINIYKADVSKATELEETFKQVIKELEVIHILHCNAGIAEEDNWRSVYDVNLVGATHSLLLGVEHMSKEKGGQGGTIIMTSSIVALSAFPFILMYNATKYAIIGLVLGFGHPVNFEKSAVRVMAICPGATDTPLLRGSREVNESLNEFLKSNPTQDASRVAEAISYMIKSGTSGSVFLADKNKTYEVEMPKLEENTYKLKQVL